MPATRTISLAWIIAFSLSLGRLASHAEEIKPVSEGEIAPGFILQNQTNGVTSLK
jgi:hypothetical protein